MSFSANIDLLGKKLANLEINFLTFTEIITILLTSVHIHAQNKILEDLFIMKKNNKKGFTLVELVIVVAVMAILVAVAIPTVSSITKSAEDSVAKTNARTIESMIKLEVANTEQEQGTATKVSTTIIDNALTEGKLGISGTFLYDDTTGAVTAVAEGTAASGTSQFVIVMDENAAAEADIVKVTQGTSSTPAEGDES